jgi:alpha-ketoglutarate-dependent taurine dioxygenase
LHTTGEVRRGNLTDVFLTSVEKVTSTVKPIALEHPRTGTTVLYACEQMTQEIPDLEPDASEQLLVALFDHMYEPDATLDHHWRERDLVVWDNIAVQHARANVGTDGPARTFRKVGHPMPRMAAEEIPVSADAR